MDKTAQQQPEWRFHCIVCEQEIPICYEGSDAPRASWPNIDGGTINIDFGFGSEFDTGLRSDIRCQAAICDGCVKKKKDLVRWVRAKTTTEWEVIDRDDEEFD